MRTPHGSELGVRKPKGEFQFISYKRVSSDAPPSPVEPEVFRAQTELNIPVDSAVGITVRDRFGKSEAIFSEPGTYRFFMAEDLETDNPPGLMRCTVRFQNR
jgi:hypothetical protein